MNLRALQFYCKRIGLVLLVSSAFLVLSLYIGKLANNVFSIVFPLFFPAIALSAWLAGRLGGFISTVFLLLGTDYFFTAPPATFHLESADDANRLVAFAISGVFVSWLSGALKEDHTVLKATLRSIGDAVIATDRHGDVRFLNPAAEQLTGWSQKDAKGRPLAQIMQSVEDGDGRALKTPEPKTLTELVSLPRDSWLVSRTGERVPVEDSMAPVRLDSGKSLGSIFVFRDATERKRAEAALLEAQQQHLQAQRLEAVGRLAGGVAHDFNNLLTIISGYANLLLKQVDPESPVGTGIEEIRRAGDRATALARQLLVFSRGQPAKLEVVDLNQVVTSFEKLLRRLIGEDVEMFTMLSAEPLPVRVDVGQIEQVIMNLALNARDAMPGGGRLTLETSVRELATEVTDRADGEPPAQYALLSMTDTGTGIGEETRRRLFEPFFTTKEIGKGTGLGLPMVYGIVKSHHGQVKVRTEPGRGSTFEVYLLLTEAKPEKPPAIPNRIENRRGTGTILLVEDNPDVQKLMRNLLTGIGYHILEASNGEEAMRVAARYPRSIELLVTDIVMPGFGGVELVRRLSPLRPAMKVLYISGYADKDRDSRALGGPTTAYLQKPFAPAEFLSKVEETISDPRKSKAS
ncbi:MAG TPA: ATP-binding protein [Bryobacteraceae bacterium]|nr:ATP-binding protein [Bryobacteraceae bacterium]